jgi:hypothetical protein
MGQEKTRASLSLPASAAVSFKPRWQQQLSVPLLLL